jgi:uncharacterized protein (TIGR02145 family)
MRRVSYVLLRILLVLVLPATFDNVAFCQESQQDSLPSKVIELSQGCQLVLDPTIDMADSLTFEIINGIREVLPKIQALIPADHVTINLAIKSDPRYVLPQLGVGGVGPSPHVASVWYDPENPNFRVEYVLQGLSHELFHSSRGRMPRFFMSLLELFVNDGLADHFMVEVFNCEQMPPFVALTEEEVLRYMAKVKPIIRNKLDSWSDCVPWMWGRKGDDPIPLWTGFTIGSKIVRDYLEAHPEARPSKLVLTSAEEIASSTPELTHEEQTGNRQVPPVDSRMHENNTYGSFTDKRDDNTYKTVKIGNQTWMAENLNCDVGDGGWVYDSNASDDATSGRLYDWKTARDACPDGWHLPSDEEWKQLEMYLDMSRADADTFGLRGVNVGSGLKSTSGWNSGGKGTNESYFSALPSGYRFTNGGFHDQGYGAYFWTSTEFDSNQAWFRSLGYDGGDVGRNSGPKEYGFSVRCIKD